MSKILDFFKKMEPSKDKKIAHTAFDAFFTFAFTPNETTHSGSHIRGGMDLKRTMIHVVIAMQLCYLFGTYNVGHQHFVALGEYTAFLEGFHLKLAHGLIKLLPLFVVANVVGLGIEFYIAAKLRKDEVSAENVELLTHFQRGGYGMLDSPIVYAYLNHTIQRVQQLEEVLHGTVLCVSSCEVNLYPVNLTQPLSVYLCQLYCRMM